MFNPVINPELALMLKRGEYEPENEITGMHLDPSQAEHAAEWDELGFTVGDEPVDLASETTPSVWERYLPNDGTPTIERRLRRQGLRKAADDEREEVQDLRIEVWSLQRRAERLHILRQRGGDIVVAH